MKKHILSQTISCVSLLIASSLTFANQVPYEEPINNLDCTEEEIMSYASKDDYEEPLGVAVMPSVEEYQPAHTQQIQTEKPEEEQGCPSMVPSGAWDTIRQEYEDAVAAINAAQEVSNNTSTSPTGPDPMTLIQMRVNEIMEDLRKEANKSVCQRIEDLGIGSGAFASEVMWDAVDERFGFDENAYNSGSKTVIQAIIKDQNRQGDGSDLSKMFEQMGAKKEGETLVDFFDRAGIDSQGIQEQAQDDSLDALDETIDDIRREQLGDAG